MRQYRLWLFIFLFLSNREALSAQVFAADGSDFRGALYVTLQTGLAFTRDFDVPPTFSVDMEQGNVYGLAIGRDYGNFRAELAYSQHSSDYNLRRQGFTDVAKSSQRVIGIMANAFYDYENSSRLTPYAGVGLGFGRVTTTPATVAGSTVDLDSEYTGLYNVMVGTNLWLNPISSFDAEYRYHDSFGKSDFAGSHDLMIQYRVNIDPLLSQFK